MQGAARRCAVGCRHCSGQQDIVAGVGSHQDVRACRLRQRRKPVWGIQILRQVQGDVLLLCGVPDSCVGGAQGRLWHGWSRVQLARAAEFACYELCHAASNDDGGKPFCDDGGKPLWWQVMRRVGEGGFIEEVCSMNAANCSECYSVFVGKR